MAFAENVWINRTWHEVNLSVGGFGFTTRLDGPSFIWRHGKWRRSASLLFVLLVWRSKGSEASQLKSLNHGNHCDCHRWKLLFLFVQLPLVDHVCCFLCGEWTNTQCKSWHIGLHMGPPWTNPVFDTISWHCAVVCMSHFMSLGPASIDRVHWRIETMTFSSYLVATLQTSQRLGDGAPFRFQRESQYGWGKKGEWVRIHHDTSE